jgi:hypothetical protein
MRFFLPALVCAGALSVASPALAQDAHRHDHKHDGHTHDGHKHDGHKHDGHKHGHGHDHGHKHDRAKPRVRKAEAPVAASPAHDHGIETEALFGFVSGSDIGHKGDRHATFFYETHFGKRSGSFRAQQPKIELGYNPTDNLHVALELWGDRFNIRDVPELDDQNRWGWGGAIEFKVQLAKRGQGSPFGVTFLLAPHYGNSEHHSGEPAQHYALELGLLADVEIVKDRLVAAFNLLYEPERVRAKGETEWEKESLFGVSGALIARVAPSIWFGGEVQYFRKYEGLAFDTFHGHALYVGPVLTLQAGEHSTFTFAWAAQVAGRSAHEAVSLDLDHFERHRIRARWSTHF